MYDRRLDPVSRQARVQHVQHVTPNGPGLLTARDLHAGDTPSSVSNRRRVVGRDRHPPTEHSVRPDTRAKKLEKELENSLLEASFKPQQSDCRSYGRTYNNMSPPE